MGELLSLLWVFWRKMTMLDVTQLHYLKPTVCFEYIVMLLNIGSKWVVMTTIALYLENRDVNNGGC